MRIFLSALICAVLVVLGTAQLADAEQSRGKDKHEERIEILTMWKMIEALNLDSATADKIMAIRYQFLTRRKEIKKALDRDFDLLRQGVKSPSTDDAELARLLQSVREKRKELVNLHGEQYDEVARILPVRKQAELILFLKDFRRQLRAGLRHQLAPPPPDKAGPLGPPNGPPAPGLGPLGPGRGGLRPPGPPPGGPLPQGAPGHGPGNDEGPPGDE